MGSFDKQPQHQQQQNIQSIHPTKSDLSISKSALEPLYDHLPPILDANSHIRTYYLQFAHYLLKFLDDEGKTIQLNLREKLLLIEQLENNNYDLERTLPSFCELLSENNKEVCSVLFVDNMAFGYNGFAGNRRRENYTKSFINVRRLRYLHTEDKYDTEGIKKCSIKFGVGLDDVAIKEEKAKHDLWIDLYPEERKEMVNWQAFMDYETHRIAFHEESEDEPQSDTPLW